jgi:hypothetical protein
MGEQARVTSLEAIKVFRARLVVFLSKARPTLEEISNEVVRTRQWLQSDQRRLWERELKARMKKLEQLEAELFTATLSALSDAATGQQMAVRHARENVRAAEEKLVTLRKWDRELAERSEPLIKQIDQLHHYFTTDMVRAVAYLDRVVTTLEAYSNVQSMPDAATHAGEESGSTVKPAEEPGKGAETP